MSVSAETGGVCLVSQVTAADTRAIEEGLLELWRMASSGELGGGLVRAASMTLVVPIGDEAAVDDVTAVLGGLTATHPCRVIMLLSDDRVAEPRARLASHSWRAADGDTPRYWEEIRLVAPARSLHWVTSAAAVLQLPNLPVQTWWPGEPDFDGDLYTRIIETSDRIVVDSSAFRGPVAGLARLAAAIHLAYESVAFADLSWTRLTPWRTLTAEFFDPPPDQDLLDSIERVVVEYDGRRAADVAQPLLFVGWLGSRLGWEPRTAAEVKPGIWRCGLVDGVRPVVIEVNATAMAPDGMEARGGLRAITIEAAEDDRSARYTIERCGDGGEARTLAEVEGGRLERLARLPIQTTEVLLREELGGYATDRIYQESLDLVVRVFGG
jgi:glucose-6-phosphate dehydrogenase assembly protein OpcA